MCVITAHTSVWTYALEEVKTQTPACIKQPMQQEMQSLYPLRTLLPDISLYVVSVIMIS